MSTSGLSCSICSRIKHSPVPLVKEPSYFIMKCLPLHSSIIKLTVYLTCHTLDLIDSMVNIPLTQTAQAFLAHY